MYKTESSTFKADLSNALYIVHLSEMCVYPFAVGGLQKSANYYSNYFFRKTLFPLRTTSLIVKIFSSQIQTKCCKCTRLYANNMRLFMGQQYARQLLAENRGITDFWYTQFSFKRKAMLVVIGFPTYIFHSNFGKLDLLTREYW